MPKVNLNATDAFSTGEVDLARLPAALVKNDQVTALTAQNYFNEQSLTISSGAVTWNLSTAQVAKLQLTQNVFPFNYSDPKPGAFYSLMLIQDATGSRTLSWSSNFKFANGTAPILSTKAGAKDIFVFRSDGTLLYEIGRSLDVS